MDSSSSRRHGELLDSGAYLGWLAGYGNESREREGGREGGDWLDPNPSSRAEGCSAARSSSSSSSS
jgi:hypothetical protein